MKTVETTDVFMIPVSVREPTPGAKVNALNRGGVAVPVVWKSDSALYYDAWFPFFKVPEEVKTLQQSRFPFPGEALPIYQEPQ